jgi:hypothetical protein
MDEELSSSSDEIPDHRRLSPWFLKLFKKFIPTFKLPDHGRQVQPFYSLRPYAMEGIPAVRLTKYHFAAQNPARGLHTHAVGRSALTFYD